MMLEEVVIKGPIMDSYYKDHPTIIEIIKHGWLYNGDIGKMDEDFIYFLKNGIRFNEQ